MMLSLANAVMAALTSVSPMDAAPRDFYGIAAALERGTRVVIVVHAVDDQVAPPTLAGTSPRAANSPPHKPAHLPEASQRVLQKNLRVARIGSRFGP